MAKILHTVTVAYDDNSNYWIKAEIITEKWMNRDQAKVLVDHLQIGLDAIEKLKENA